MDQETKFVLDWCNRIFLVIFFGEMVLKIYGLTFYTYLRDWFNVYDMVTAHYVDEKIDLILDSYSTSFAVISLIKALPKSLF